MACDLANNLIPTIHQAVLSHSQGPSNPLSSQKKMVTQMEELYKHEFCEPANVGRED